MQRVQRCGDAGDSYQLIRLTLVYHFAAELLSLSTALSHIRPSRATFFLMPTQGLLRFDLHFPSFMSCLE